MKEDSVKQTVIKRFSAAADTYDARATVQTTVAGKLMPMIPVTPPARRILEVGCGTGLLTRFLLQCFPNADIDAIDTAPGMIDRARRHFGAEPRMNWVLADAGEFQGSAPYSLIVSNCTLHWMDPFAQGMRHVASLLDRGGRLVFSIMLNGTLGELRDSRLRVAPGKPPFGRLPTIEEVGQNLELAGCDVIDAREETEVETYPSAYDFIRSIHELGVTGGAVSRSHLPLSRIELSQLLTDYEEHWTAEGDKVYASFHAGYVTAVKR